MCELCRDRIPGRRFVVDGTDRLLCGPCVRDQRRIAEAHAQVRAIHRAAHGYDGECPVCRNEAWLAQQRILEELEMQAARAAVQRVLPPASVRRVA